VDDTSSDDRVARDPYLTGEQHCSLLVVPVLSQGVPRAMLLLENRLARRAFSTDRLDAVLLIAGQLTVLIDNALVYASLERKVSERTEELAEANLRLELLAVTDPLTGLANRRRLSDVLEEEWLRGRRSGQPISLAMIDIDHFKKYNDHYGHQGGDECLRLVARTVQGIARATDLVARYGGEEFCVVMPGTDAEGARLLAERIRQAVADLCEPHTGSDTGIVTISVGLSTAVPADGPPDQLIKVADQALYEAKRDGRNRVAGSSPSNVSDAKLKVPRQFGATDIVISSAERGAALAEALGAPGVLRAASWECVLAAATSRRWKSRSTFTSGLLATSTEAQPLNAPSPSAPVRPLIITTEPLSRTSALAENGACKRPGASRVNSIGTFCRSIGGAGAVALISNLSG